MYSSRSEYIVNSINRIYGFDYDSTNSENSLLNEEFWSIPTVYDNGTVIDDNVEEIIMRNNTKLKEDVMKEMQNRGFVGGRRKHKNKKTRKNRKK
jgi:predicted proteasome-type protease